MTQQQVRVLQLELRTYRNHKADLLRKYRDQFVLIKKNKVVGIYDTEKDAIREGFARFGNTPFLVKHIIEVEPTINYVTPGSGAMYEHMPQ